MLLLLQLLLTRAVLLLLLPQLLLLLLLAKPVLLLLGARRRIRLRQRRLRRPIRAGAALPRVLLNTRRWRIDGRLRAVAIAERARSGRRRAGCRLTARIGGLGPSRRLGVRRRRGWLAGASRSSAKRLGLRPWLTVRARRIARLRAPVGRRVRLSLLNRSAERSRLLRLLRLRSVLRLGTARLRASPGRRIWLCRRNRPAEWRLLAVRSRLLALRRSALQGPNAAAKRRRRLSGRAHRSQHLTRRLRRLPRLTSCAVLIALPRPAIDQPSRHDPSRNGGRNRHERRDRGGISAVTKHRTRRRRDEARRTKPFRTLLTFRRP